MIFKLLKFGIVGSWGMVIDFSITILLKEKLKVHRYISSSAGFSAAATSNYLLNRIWTFQSNNPKVVTEYGTFLLVSLIGLAVNNIFLFLFEKRFSFYLSKVLATIVTVLWNFFANYYITFNLRF
jgi:putative flippase GtrA